MADEIEQDVNSILSGEPEQLRNSLAEQTRIAEETPPSQTSSGTIPPAVEASGVPLDPDKRRSINLALASLAVAGIGLLGEGGNLFLSNRQVQLDAEAVRLAKKQLDQAARAEEESRWGIPSEFSVHLSSINYAEDPLEKYSGPVNQGVEAIVASTRALRGRELGLFPNIHTNIERAIRATADDNGVVLGLSRVAIDNSFSGDGRRALQALERVNLDNINDDQTLIRLLDFGTSVALNAIDPVDFRMIKSPILARFERGWQRVGIDETDPTTIAAYASRFGVGIFAIAQRVGIQDLNAASPTQHSVGQARERWFNLIRDVMHSTQVGTRAAMYAEDFLYSLHRPAFHAVAWKDYDSAKSILDYYFGRKHYSAPLEHEIEAVRKTFKADLPGSSPWMFLLDATLDTDQRRAKSKIEHIAAKSVRLTPQFKKALVHLAVGLKMSRKDMLRTLHTTSVKVEAFSTTVHRVYMSEASELPKV